MLNIVDNFFHIWRNKKKHHKNCECCPLSLLGTRSENKRDNVGKIPILVYHYNGNEDYDVDDGATCRMKNSNKKNTAKLYADALV